ncbi:hypothetical protein VTJ49DRAFT_1805 [Mycothermus thermophilus]|uniref:Uncharacterized protein n=1 Tax=Humicola insolens TaxID=85995 RepID=A0ABR3VCS1_HUMIN
MNSTASPYRPYHYIHTQPHSSLSDPTPPPTKPIKVFAALLQFSSLFLSFLSLGDRRQNSRNRPQSTPRREDVNAGLSWICFLFVQNGGSTQSSWHAEGYSFSRWIFLRSRPPTAILTRRTTTSSLFSSRGTRFLHPGRWGGLDISAIFGLAMLAF